MSVRQYFFLLGKFLDQLIANGVRTKEQAKRIIEDTEKVLEERAKRIRVWAARAVGVRVPWTRIGGLPKDIEDWNLQVFDDPSLLFNQKQFDKAFSEYHPVRVFAELEGKTPLRQVLSFFEPAAVAMPGIVKKPGDVSTLQTQVIARLKTYQPGYLDPTSALARQKDLLFGRGKGGLTGQARADYWVNLSPEEQDALIGAATEEERGLLGGMLRTGYAQELAEPAARKAAGETIEFGGTEHLRQGAMDRARNKAILQTFVGGPPMSSYSRQALEQSYGSALVEEVLGPRPETQTAGPFSFVGLGLEPVQAGPTPGADVEQFMYGLPEEQRAPFAKWFKENEARIQGARQSWYSVLRSTQQAEYGEFQRGRENLVEINTLLKEQTRWQQIIDQGLATGMKPGFGGAGTPAEQLMGRAHQMVPDLQARIDALQAAQREPVTGTRTPEQQRERDILSIDPLQRLLGEYPFQEEMLDEVVPKAVPVPERKRPSTARYAPQARWFVGR